MQRPCSIHDTDLLKSVTVYMTAADMMAEAYRLKHTGFCRKGKAVDLLRNGGHASNMPLFCSTNHSNHVVKF